MSAVYENPVAETPPDLFNAVRDCLRTLVRPAMNENAIVSGWKNQASLVPETTDFAVVTATSAIRRGTNVSTFDPETEKMTVRELVEVTLDVDFCSDTDATALTRAVALSLIARDELGVSFFEPYGIACLFADDPKRMEADEKIAFVRYTTTLHVSYWAGVTVDIASFDTITPSLENVDVHHPQKTTE